MISSIEISKLYQSPLNTYDLSNIDELMASIEQMGLLSPLTVWKDAEGKYEVLSGNRRLMAMQRLHANNPGEYGEVACEVIDNPDFTDDDKLVIVEAANLLTREIDPKDKPSHMIKLMKALKKTSEDKKEARNKFVEYCKVTPRYAYFFDNLAESDDEELIKLVEQGTDVKLASQISTMEDDDKEKAKDAIKAVKDDKEKPTQKEEKEAVAQALGKMDKISQDLDGLAIDDLEKLMEDASDPTLPDIKITNDNDFDEFDALDTVSDERRVTNVLNRKKFFADVDEWLKLLEKEVTDKDKEILTKVKKAYDKFC